LLAEVQAILGQGLIGLYLDGSIALGEFEADRSDIDFVAVTGVDVSHETFRALAALHAQLAADSPRWGLELEGSYVAATSIRHHDVRPGAHPYIDRGTGRLEIVQPENGYWVIHRHVLREHGVVLAGPTPRTLIDAVDPDELRRAVVDLLREWWAPMLADASRLQHWGYRCYAVLTMCRILYSVDRGTVVSKRRAASWVQTVEPRWMGVIAAALAWSPTTPPDLPDTLALIRHTVEGAT
jgi:hypothetical protein